MPSTIELFLNRAMCADLQTWLVQKLDVTGPDAQARMSALLVQDPKITSTRERLNAEISKLRSIQRELRGLAFSERPANDGVGLAVDGRGPDPVQNTVFGSTHTNMPNSGSVKINGTSNSD